jgi:endothelin-converting enzyme/putative endopeptidase
MKQIQAEYQTHVAAMFRLAGFDDSDARAQRVIALEKALARTHTSLAENEDIHKADNTWKRSEFSAKAPGLDWTEYFRAAKLADQDSFIVWQPTAFTGEAALVASTPVDTWKDWLAYHLIEQYAGVLPKALADERFDFFGKTLVGVPQQRPRAQRGVFVVDGLLGDAVGKIYAQRYFSPQAKAAAEAMVAGGIKQKFRICLILKKMRKLFLYFRQGIIFPKKILFGLFGKA